MLKKCTPLWRKTHVEVEMLKTPHVRTTFGRPNVVSRGRRKGLRTLSKVSQTWRFCSSFKNDGRRRTFEEDLERCISRGRRSTRDTWVRCVKRSGRRFPQRGGILEHAIVSFAKMILRDRCSTSYDLASLSRGRRNCCFFDVVKFEYTLHYTITTSTTTTTTTATLHYTTLYYTTCITPHCATLITLHATPRRATPLHSTALRHATLHYITPHYNYSYSYTYNYATLHYITLHFTTLHYPALHYTTLITPPHMQQMQLHYTNHTTLQLQLRLRLQLNYITLHCATRITLHHATLH